MELRSAFILSLLVASGCREPAIQNTNETQITPRIQFERSIEKHGKVTFLGWNGIAYNEDASFRMEFRKDSIVELEIFGYNVEKLPGTYGFTDDGSMKIAFDAVPESSKLGYTTHWPLLRLSQEGGDFLVHRVDGKTDWHIDWPLSPSIVVDVWPARASAVIPLFTNGDESYFFSIAEEPAGQRIEGNNLNYVLPIQRINPPGASSIMAFHQGLGPGREYKIQVNLRERPQKGWKPALNLGGEIFVEGISVALPNDPRSASSFSLESDSPGKIRRWCQLLGELLKVPAERVEIDLREIAPDGADQPTTAPESEAQANEKPKSDSEVRPR